MVKHAVLFIAFNRLEEAIHSFKAIEEYKPPRLYLAIDGPREKFLGEDEKIIALRKALVSRINWPCKLYKRFPDNNLGCKLAVSSAIDWVFENEEEVIIIEDDCLVNADFFTFCDHNLEKYKDHDQIWHIAGYCRGLNLETPSSSYRFSILGSIWGWATWKRAWNNYSLHPDLSLWSFTALVNLSRNSQIPLRELRGRITNLKKIHNNVLDTWDYQWSWAKIIKNGLTISPYNSLVINLGLLKGTHNMDTRDLIQNAVKPLGPIIDPGHIVIDYSYENRFFRPTLLERLLLRIRIRRI